MKTRSNPATLRALAHLVRLEDGLKQINLQELAQQLEAAAWDVETLAEDLEMEREMTRAMAQDIAILRPPGALK